jgi:hypothetical protein
MKNPLRNTIETVRDAHEFLTGKWATRPNEIGFDYSDEDLKGYRKLDLIQLAHTIADQIDTNRNEWTEPTRFKDELKTREKDARTIDLTPTWLEAVKMCRALIENGTNEGKANAWKEIERMAKIADHYVQIAKTADEVNKAT